MNILIRAELAKLLTLRSFWWTVAATLAFVPVSIAIAINGGNDAPAIDTTDGFRNVMAAASSGGFLMLIIGILMTAGEFRHNTITSTLLITPDRKRAIGAKLASVRRRRRRARRPGLGCSRSRSPCPGSRSGTSISARTARTSSSCSPARSPRRRSEGRWESDSAPS